MKVYLAQIDTTVGDIDGNVRKILGGIEDARGRGADLVVFPELTIPGYPPRDLLEKRSFVRSNLAALERVASATTGIAAVVGYVEPNASEGGRPLYNMGAVCRDGKVIHTVAKQLLPTYDVFDEDRHFEAGHEAGLVAVQGRKVGLSICEDAWIDPSFFGRRRYTIDPIGSQADRGAQILVNISASPFALGRPAYRETLFSDHASRHRLPLVYVNLVGGNDELLFDGRSFVVDESGRMIAALAAFREDAALVEVEIGDGPRRSAAVHASGREEKGTHAATENPDEDAKEAFDALVMGTRDYALKCGFERAVIGLSGGIDSSVVAAVAVEALGPGAVTGVSMPSRHSSPGSTRDAALLAANLGIELLTLPIERAYVAYVETLAGPFAARAEDVTEENLQSRIRGTLLMALSNKFGWLVLTTGNKSETAVGYTTLYGDMSGGLAVLSDAPKTLVYRIARSINRRREVIPEAVFTKPPSAELRPDQKDQDSLPPYEVLDGILRLYVEELRSVREIVDAGYDPATVREIVRRVDRSEYKRKQAPPGLRITSKAFGLGRRMPIAQRYVEP